MDNDQTVFQSSNSQSGISAPEPFSPIPAQTVSPVPSTQPVPPVPTPQAVVSEPFIQAPPAEVIAQEPIVEEPPSQVPPKSTSGNTTALLRKIVKVGIGLAVVIVVLILLVNVVLPMILGGSNGKVTLNYWGLWEDSKTMQSLIAGFERENPNITVQYSQQDIKQYRERVITRIANGNGPDVFRFQNTWYPMYASVLLPLPTDTISPVDFKKTFYPVAQKDLIKNGAIYGIPLEIDTLVLYVNSGLFKAAGLQPPANWNDFISDARAMTVKDADGKIKTAGAAMGTYDNITHAPDILSLLFLQNGVDPLKIQDSSDRAANALDFYTAFATDTNNVWDNTLDPSILAFSRGNLAMYFGYSWDYFTIKQNNPNLTFQVVPVPQLPNQAVNLASYWAEGVSVKSKHQKEALLFMKYLVEKSTEESLYAEQAKTRTFGEPYARVDLGNTLKSNPVLAPFVAQAPSAFSSPFVDSTYDNGLNQELNTYLGNAVNAVINGSSPQTALGTFSQGATQVLQKYGQ
ncbi:MAG TPA: sugar ABC transporter substrate-binding protein [Patescibacteria group bacterium]|jgi:multiple sugar transport system substrate-binding protein|nr:sugar ABC transporter substrate-binding protein [Patescibacteria group bacterium]